MSKLHAKRVCKTRKVEEDSILDSGIAKPTLVFAVPNPQPLSMTSLENHKVKKKLPQMSFTMSANLARELFDI